MWNWKHQRDGDDGDDDDDDDDDVYLVSIGLVRMEMQVAEEDPAEPAAERNVDKKVQDAVVWPLVVTKPLSTYPSFSSLTRRLK